jgi:hypothetical protein
MGLLSLFNGGSSTTITDDHHIVSNDKFDYSKIYKGDINNQQFFYGNASDIDWTGANFATSDTDSNSSADDFSSSQDAKGGNGGASDIGASVGLGFGGSGSGGSVSKATQKKTLPVLSDITKKESVSIDDSKIIYLISGISIIGLFSFILISKKKKRRK